MQTFFRSSIDPFLNIVKILTYKIIAKISKEMTVRIVKMAKNMSQRATAKELRISRNPLEVSKYKKCFGSTKMWLPSKIAAQGGMETDQDNKNSVKGDCKRSDG